MSSRVFKALLKIVKYSCLGGFHISLDGEDYPGELATMEMEGNIHECSIDGYKKRFSDEKKTWVNIDIIFSQHRVNPCAYKDEKENYIGHMNLYEPRKVKTLSEGVEIAASIELYLPLTMLSRLLPAKGETLVFESMADDIGKPTKDKRMGDSLIVGIKRVKFDVAFGITEKPE